MGSAFRHGSHRCGQQTRTRGPRGPEVGGRRSGTWMLCIGHGPWPLWFFCGVLVFSWYLSGIVFVCFWRSGFFLVFDWSVVFFESILERQLFGIHYVSCIFLVCFLQIMALQYFLVFGRFVSRTFLVVFFVFFWRVFGIVSSMFLSLGCIFLVSFLYVLNMFWYFSSVLVSFWYLAGLFLVFSWFSGLTL